MSSRTFWIIISLMVIGCAMALIINYVTKPDETNPACREAEISEVGIVIYGYSFRTPSRIKNTNDNPVRIKKVTIHTEGETTEWIRVLEPGNEMEAAITANDGFYVLSMEGGEIGFIRLIRPEGC